MSGAPIVDGRRRRKAGPGRTVTRGEATFFEVHFTSAGRISEVKVDAEGRRSRNASVALATLGS